MDSLQIEQLAGQWIARRDRSDWSGHDEAEFQAWLGQSTAHMVAFVRLEAAWKQAKRLKALAADVQPGQVPAPENWQLTPFFDEPGAPRVSRLSGLLDHGSGAETSESPDSGVVRHEDSSNGTVHYPPGVVTHAPAVGTVAGGSTHRTRRLAIAASVLFAAAGSVAWHVWETGPDYSTPVGGLSFVPMPDGSKVTLNTDSEIRVAVTEKERRVELRQGEAFFEVASDPSRAFVVTAGTKRVIAVGTAFSVRRNGDDIRVAITEGRVRIEDGAERPAALDLVDEKVLTLSAGSVARSSAAGVLVQKKPVAEIQSDLSWRTGYLIFRDMAIADAIAEFNRYNARKIFIDDPAVATIRVSGKFRATQFEAFVRLLEQGFPVRAQRVGDRILLTDSRSAPSAAGSGQE
jgi:transmembrane sensor